MLTVLLVCTIFMTSGCGKDSNNNDYGVDLESENTLSCTSMRYNIFGNLSSNVFETHLFFAEYDDNKTNMISAKEIYTADYSNSNSKLTKEDMEKVKDGFKTNFCDVRKQLITPSGYDGDAVSCNITDKDDIVTVEMVYPKDAIEYAKSKGYLGTLEETCNKVIDFVIDSFTERAKDFDINVTRK